MFEQSEKCLHGKIKISTFFVITKTLKSYLQRYSLLESFLYDASIADAQQAEDGEIIPNSCSCATLVI